MVYIFMLIGVVVIIALCVQYSKYRAKKRRLATARATVLPTSLGVRPELHLEEHVASLEYALTDRYKENMKVKFLMEHTNSQEEEYDMLFFELKRYLLMCSLFKKVPMFSPEVDEIWHNMIMYTLDYSQFCKNFCGNELHHKPSEQTESDPHGRAMFDLLYTIMFEHTDYTPYAWGEFFHHPLEKEHAESMLAMDNETFIEQHFRATVEPKVAHAITATLQELLADSVTTEYDRISYLSRTPGDDQAIYLAGAMICFSILHPDQFASQMNGIHAKNMNDSNVSCSDCDSSCSGGD